jgi:tight adherence protein C
VSVTLAALLAVVASVLAVASVATAGDAPALARLGVGERGPRRARAALGRVGASTLGRLPDRRRLDALAKAASTGGTVDELVGAKLLGPPIAIALSVAGGIPLLALPIAFIAWRAPDVLLARHARRRVARASQELPLFLDLLAVATSAGLAPQLAVRLAAEPLVGPLADDLGSAIRRADLGGRWRDEVAAVAERSGLPDLRRATTILGRSETLGSALADEVSRLAADVRGTRRARAAERARTAPVKMLFPLVFLILPAFLLLTVVPVLLSTLRSIG